MLETVPFYTTSPISNLHLPTHAEARESLESDAPPTPRVSALERIATSQLSPAFGGLTPVTLRSPRSVRSRSSFTPHHRRPMSLHTVGSAGDSIFFDAEDGGLEFVDMDRTMTSTRSDSDQDEDEDEDETGVAAHVIVSVTADGELFDVDGESDDIKTPATSRPPEHALDVSETSILGSSISQVSSSSTVSIKLPSLALATFVTKTALVRRTRLPAPTSGEQLSLFTMLKRNIGKVRRREMFNIYSPPHLIWLPDRISPLSRSLLHLTNL